MAERSSAASNEIVTLHKLAALYGLQTHFIDVRGERRDASPESLLAILKLLGAPLTRVADAAAATRDRVQSQLNRCLEPVVVAWDGHVKNLRLRLPATSNIGKYDFHILNESGESHSWTGRVADLPTEESNTASSLEKKIHTSLKLGPGFHQLAVDLAGARHESLLISAPTRAYAPTGHGWQRSWGAFAPLYALRSEASWGAGDFNDLRSLGTSVRELGGGFVATLPLLAAFLDESYEVSPYSPVSRLFWNEIYLAIEQIPELSTTPSARRLVESASLQSELKALRASKLVDYRRVMAVKRCVLADLSKTFFATPSSRRDAFQAYRASHRYLESYAEFRAAMALRKQPWTEWPDRSTSSCRALDGFNEVKQYHMYVQWLANEQLESISRDDACGLYLDLPLGVNSSGYDVWHEPSLFATGVAGGCPPDIVFPKGQNWGFVPLHPENLRTLHYRYVRDFLEHQMRCAKVLRIDHMPSFHRVWWIPPGASASEGVYVNYPSEELYAVFSLESHRHKTMLVGEDLGTVPREVPRAMVRHNVHRMYVVQYEVQPDSAAALPEPPASSIASLNTHDMPPFTGFWNGTDLKERILAGLLDDAGREKAVQTKVELQMALHTFLIATEYLPPGEDSASQVYDACLAFLRDSAARMLLLNVEDLYGEKSSQNVPSSADQETNWRRKMAVALPELRVLLADTIQKLHFDTITRPS